MILMSYSNWIIDTKIKTYSTPSLISLQNKNIFNSLINYIRIILQHSLIIIIVHLTSIITFWNNSEHNPGFRKNMEDNPTNPQQISDTLSTWNKEQNKQRMRLQIDWNPTKNNNLELKTSRKKMLSGVSYSEKQLCFWFISIDIWSEERKTCWYSNIVIIFNKIYIQMEGISLNYIQKQSWCYVYFICKISANWEYQWLII